MQLFGRKVKLKVEAPENAEFKPLDIDKLNVEFEVTRTLEKEPSTLRASVYNLSESTRSALEEDRRLIVTLSAGYGTAHDLFVGDVRIVRHKREGPNIVTEIEAGDGEKGSKNWARQWFKKDTSIETVLKYLARKAELGEGNISRAVNIAEDDGLPTTLKTGLHVRGYAVDELNELCNSRGIEFSIQNGDVQILEFGKALEGAQVVRVSPSSGLVGTPTIDNDNIMTADLRLLPNVFPGSILEVDSEFVTGQFKVLRAFYTGSLYGPDFTCSVEGKEIKR